MPARGAICCAIYTRKSSDEGLEQEFNSLDAQREACEAYIRSQRHEGWVALQARYDDGGFSGGTMNRPALQQLLSDIAAGQIDIIVVYKVDRLTRSLMDFSKIVEGFDQRGVSFVSVTQQFSTTTSMGRLTLNMLLSFAQFEREVTGERIRDKIAASKQKGMWMGGRVPLGYDANGRTLAVNDAEAVTIRLIFALYVELGSVRALKAEVDRQRLCTKPRVTSTGQTVGGCHFSRGNLYALLSNALYVGDIRHKGKSYPGQHPAIIDRETWDAVQGKLAANLQGHRDRTSAADPSLLAGLIFDSHGNRLTPTHAAKSGRRYRYYTTLKLLQTGRIRSRGYRIPAHEVEQLVSGALVALLENKRQLIEILGRAVEAKHYLIAAASLAREFSKGNLRLAASAIRSILKRVIVDERQVELVVAVDALAQSLGVDQLEDNDATFSIPIPTRLKRCGFGAKFILDGDNVPIMRSKPDPSLIKAIVRATDCFDRLISGRADSIGAVAEAEGLSASFLARGMRLAFLAPDIVQSILDGDQPRTLTIDRLVQRSAELPIAWTEQRKLFGFA